MLRYIITEIACNMKQNNSDNNNNKEEETHFDAVPLRSNFCMRRARERALSA